MPNAINFNTPPRPTGEPEHQIGQMHNWLYQMVEQLNIAMSVVQAQDAAIQTLQQGGNAEGGSGTVTTDDLNNQRDQPDHQDGKHSSGGASAGGQAT